MCRFISGLIMRSGEIICDPEHTDSHEDLITAANIRDGRCQDKAFVRFEFVPGDDVANLDSWSLVIDEASEPDWLDKHDLRRRMETMTEKMIVRGERNILLGGCWILADGAKVDTVKSARIYAMYGSSRMRKMLDLSRVEMMFNSSYVETIFDSSRVEAMFNSSRVETMYGSSRVEAMYNSSRVETMYESSRVYKKFNSAWAPR